MSSCPYCDAHTYLDQESPCVSIELWACGTRYDDGDYNQSAECERRVEQEEEHERMLSEISRDNNDTEDELHELYGEKITRPEPEPATIPHSPMPNNSRIGILDIIGMFFGG